MNTENSLSLENRKELTRVIEHALDNLMEYYVSTFREANRQYKVSNEAFWKNLFVTKQASKAGNRWKISLEMAPLLLPKDYPVDPVPEDPYIYLDIQACSKYLIHGEKRISGMKRNTPLVGEKKTIVSYLSR